MGFANDADRELRGNFDLLCNIIRQSKDQTLRVDLGRIEKIVKTEIPEALKKNAPPNYYELYMDFQAVYEKFRDFILYDQLIGKKVVALGGGFSSGKSSFINALDGENALPVDIDPSTSVPTYIVNGEKPLVRGINIFDATVEIAPRDIKKIAHGFGESDDGDSPGGAALGHILESIFLATPKQRYHNIAFLDTPGYSKPDSEKYSARTDEEIARRQLNSSDFILWFVQADAGTITNEDVQFIRTLREDIPKLIILNKADKKPDSELAGIMAKIRSTLEVKGIRYVDVLAFSKNRKDGYDRAEIDRRLAEWDRRSGEKPFARSFKELFVRCREFYDDEIENERRRLSRVNLAGTKLPQDVDPVVTSSLAGLKQDIQKNIEELKEVKEQTKRLQDEFFGELKRVGDEVGIAMPEPREVELMRDTVQDPMKLIAEYRQKKGIRSDGPILEIIRKTLSDVEPEFDRQAGGSAYRDRVAGIIRENCTVEPKDIHLNDSYLKNLKDILSNMQNVRSKNFNAAVRR